jgi:hypothetical protein
MDDKRCIGVLYRLVRKTKQEKNKRRKKKKKEPTKQRSNAFPFPPFDKVVFFSSEGYI